MIRRMRVLVCTFTYPPNRDGVSTAAETMAVGLSRRGHEVTVATTTHPNRSVTGGVIDGVRVHEFLIQGAPNVRGGYSGEVKRYQDWLFSEGFDFIFCHCWYTWPTDLLMALADRLPAKKIFVSHGFSAQVVDWHPRFPWGLGAWLRFQPYVWRLPRNLRRFDWGIFLSERANLGRFFDRWVAERTGYRTYSVIPNSTDPGKFPKERGRFRKEFHLGDGLIFLCVANYCSRKNQALAVRAFRRARLAQATLVFIGSELAGYGESVRELDRELSRTQPDGRAVFLDAVPGDLTLAAFVDCDVFVLTAKAETQPVAIIEAMACGKPFISTNTGCVSEFKGGIVASGEASIATTMRNLASDAALRAQLGAIAAQDARERFTNDRTLDTYEALMHRQMPAENDPHIVK